MVNCPICNKTMMKQFTDYYLCKFCKENNEIRVNNLGFYRMMNKNGWQIYSGHITSWVYIKDLNKEQKIIRQKYIKFVFR